MNDNEDIVDDLEYDVYNLVACNHHTIQLLGDQESKEEILKTHCQRATQLLMKKLFECPTESSEVGSLVLLPNEIFQLPRSYKVPEPKPETKWEKFAKEKGILHKKKERMVYDENQQEFRPRYGYKRANNGIEDIPIIEIKNGQDPYQDPWSNAREEKKSRVKKNLKNQLRNQGRANGTINDNQNKLKSNSESKIQHIGIPTDLNTKSFKKGKLGLKNTLQLVQHSTASMGRFDEMRPGEPLRKISGKKRSFRDNIKDSKQDKESMKAQLRFVADKEDKKLRGVTNSLTSYEGILPDAPTDGFKQKKGKGKQITNNKKKMKKN